MFGPRLLGHLALPGRTSLYSLPCQAASQEHTSTARHPTCAASRSLPLSAAMPCCRSEASVYLREQHVCTIATGHRALSNAGLISADLVDLVQLHAHMAHAARALPRQGTSACDCACSGSGTAFRAVTSPFGYGNQCNLEGWALVD